MPPRHTIQHIAQLTDGQVSNGDASCLIEGVADLRIARPDQLSFYADPKYLNAARKTQAGALIVPLDFDQTLKPVLIKVKNPIQAFAQVVRLFSPEPIQWKNEIHPSAVISEKASIGKDVHVGPCAVIQDDVTVGDHTHIGAGVYIGHRVSIGSNTFIHPNVTIQDRTRIGSNVIIHPGAVIGSDGFGYEFKDGAHHKIPQIGYVQIDDDVEIGANATIDRGRFDKTWIQKGTKIDNLVMIAHNVVIGEHSLLVAQTGISGSVHCGNYVTMAGQSSAVGHINIGDRVTITGKTAATKDCEPGGIYAGRRARPYNEAMKIEALINRLPHLFEKITKLEKKISKSDKA